MRRSAAVAVFAVSGFSGLVGGHGGVAQAETKAAPNARGAKRPVLELSVEVQRCLRVGKLPGAGSEERQLHCLASQDESGFVELVRSIAKWRRQKAGFGADRLEHMSWKVRKALSEGRQEAAVAVETMLDDAPVADAELEATALEAMRWVTIARRKADLPKSHQAGAARPLVVAPRACAERVDAPEPRIAQRAVACVAEAQTEIPTARLIDAVLKEPARVEIWRLLKRLRQLPEPEARRLAEALIAARDDDDGRADDLCEILNDATPVDAAWATLAGRRAFDQLGVKECRELARRSNKPQRTNPQEPGPSQSHCLDVPVMAGDYVTICAVDLGPNVNEAARRAEVQARPSRFGRYREGQEFTTFAWLLEGERPLVSELSYLPLPRPERDELRVGSWHEGLVVVPSSTEAGGQRRLHVFGLQSRRLIPLWQSPECVRPGCRIDLVARRKLEGGELLELLLLTERQAQPIALDDLLQGTLDERLGCSRLRPLSLSDCSRLGVRQAERGSVVP